MSRETLNKTQRVPGHIIFTDLDGTLIFSASKKLSWDIVCEYKDGKEISCITPRQAELLPKLHGIIPVTTRSIEQYRRIRFPEGFSPEYALTDNGGTLLINGEPDRAWTENSLRIAEECSKELERCRQTMENDVCRSFEIRLVDGMFLFTKSDDPERSLELLKSAAGDRVRCYAAGSKLYAVPAEICKGAAAKRLAERLCPGKKIVCAGDSLMDIPLLDIADVAVFPEDIGERISAGRLITSKRERFPEFVTERFAELLGVKSEE